MNSENQGVSDASIEREIQAKGLTAPATPPIPAHQQRVIDEKRELDDKIDALSAYFDKDLPGASAAQRNFLSQQLDVMLRYSELLELRIQDFGRAA